MILTTLLGSRSGHRAAPLLPLARTASLRAARMVPPQCQIETLKIYNGGSIKFDVQNDLD